MLCVSGLHAVGLHMLIVTLLFGEVDWVMAEKEDEYVKELPFSKNYLRNDPRVRATIKFKNGITGYFANTALTEYTYFELEILCKKIRVLIMET